MACAEHQTGGGLGKNVRYCVVLYIPTHETNKNERLDAVYSANDRLRVAMMDKLL